MTRRPQASVVASPVLVGAVTLLVSIVAVVLAVQANKGLPFVPTYDVKIELPGGSNLLQSNEVRMGGFRVGLIDRLEPAVSDGPGQRAIAVAHVKLDKIVEPLPLDTQVKVRPRSALGLKYIELTPGRSERGYRAGATVPVANAEKPIELDEFFSTNNAEFRRNQRAVLQGYGTALAGRGVSINRVIEDAVPFVTHLEPVMRALSDPETRLGEFFRQAERTAEQIDPVRERYASLFVNMATTFEAFSRHEERLRGTIERAAPTIEQGIRSFPVQRPFLAESERLAAELEPVAVEMRRSLPAAADALEVGTPVLSRAPVLYRRTEEVFAALDELASEPTTLLALKDLRALLAVAAPLVQHVAPYQTVCNYWNYYWNALSEHVSEPARGGTGQRTIIKTENRTQDNRITVSDADRPADIPHNLPYNAKDPEGNPLVALHTMNYHPAIDAQGKADCRLGQRGYLAGPLHENNRYGPREEGGQHTVLSSEIGVRYGGTYKSRELGIDGIEDVP
jgi:virulence factor Mce-like protein